MDKEKRWVRHIYPWESLVETGDFFEVPEDKRSTGRQLVFAANKKVGWKMYAYESATGRVVML